MSSNARTLSAPNTYAGCVDLFASKRSKWAGKVGPNTYLLPLGEWFLDFEQSDDPYHRSCDAYGLKYHQTVVAEIHKSGKFVFHTGGWRTFTTKDRINEALPDGWGLGSEDGEWVLWRRGNASTGYRPRAEYFVGDDWTMTPDGLGDWTILDGHGQPMPRIVRVALLRSENRGVYAVELNAAQDGVTAYWANGGWSEYWPIDNGKEVRSSDPQAKQLLADMRGRGCLYPIVCRRNTLRKQLASVAIRQEACSR